MPRRVLKKLEKCGMTKVEDLEGRMIHDEWYRHVNVYLWRPGMSDIVLKLRALEYVVDNSFGRNILRVFIK